MPTHTHRHSSVVLPAPEPDHRPAPCLGVWAQDSESSRPPAGASLRGDAELQTPSHPLPPRRALEAVDRRLGVWETETTEDAKRWKVRAGELEERIAQVEFEREQAKECGPRGEELRTLSDVGRGASLLPELRDLGAELVVVVGSVESRFWLRLGRDSRFGRPRAAPADRGASLSCFAEVRKSQSEWPRCHRHLAVHRRGMVEHRSVDSAVVWNAQGGVQVRALSARLVRIDGLPMSTFPRAPERKRRCQDASSARPSSSEFHNARRWRAFCAARRLGPLRGTRTASSSRRRSVGSGG